MSMHNDSPRPCMSIAEAHLTYEQVQAAMKAMMEKVIIFHNKLSYLSIL